DRKCRPPRQRRQRNVRRGDRPETGIHTMVIDMPETRTGDSLLLPERARLLHIGPMKTGTTSLQSAASKLRARLLAHGVRYPGVTMNHRRAVGAFMNKAVSPERRSGAVGERVARDS